jgi:hypothetical protein
MPDIHPCGALTVTGTPCKRFLGTREVSPGVWRCAHHLRARDQRSPDPEPSFEQHGPLVVLSWVVREIVNNRMSHARALWWHQAFETWRRAQPAWDRRTAEHRAQQVLGDTSGHDLATQGPRHDAE